MDATMQKLYVNLPISEVNFFKEFIRKMGWTICDNVAEKQSDNTQNELCADNVIIKSNYIEINELHADKIIITKPFTLNFLRKRLYVNEIECTTIEAEGLKCKKLCAHDVKLFKKCEIDVLEYSGNLEIENGCIIKEIIKL